VGGYVGTISYIPRLGDIDILKSYFLLVWTEKFIRGNIDEMESLIREHFGGIRMEGHREDLIIRLVNILGELDRMPESRSKGEAVAQYTKLKDALLELHRD
jgi:hypothetical protein